MPSTITKFGCQCPFDEKYSNRNKTRVKRKIIEHIYHCISKMPRTPRRDIVSILQICRNVLLGREHNSALRIADECSKRDQPPPNIPGGPAHKLSANWYVNRDARRLVAPPVDVTKVALTSGESSAESTVAARLNGLPIPGKPYPLDHH